MNSTGGRRFNLKFSTGGRLLNSVAADVSRL
jgi:hypothetical protein